MMALANKSKLEVFKGVTRIYTNRLPWIAPKMHRKKRREKKVLEAWPGDV